MINKLITCGMVDYGPTESAISESKSGKEYKKLVSSPVLIVFFFRKLAVECICMYLDYSITYFLFIGWARVFPFYHTFILPWSCRSFVSL